MKKHSFSRLAGAVTAIFIAFYGFAIGGPTQKSEAVLDFFKGNDGVRPGIYKLQARNFSETDAKGKLDVLMKQGFSWSDAGQTDEEVYYRNPSKEQWLVYNKKESTYRYYDKSLGGLTAKEAADLQQLRKKADAYASEFVGPDFNDFKYRNCEYEYMEIRGQPRQLMCVTYRYVRMIDGREILGIAGHVRVKIGNGGHLKLVEYTHPALTKIVDLNAKIKRGSFAKYLDAYVESPDFKEKIPGLLPIKNVTAVEATSSYFTEQVGQEQWLLPHITFKMQIEPEKGGIEKGEFHLKEDAERVPGVEPEDIVRYRKLDK